MARKDEALEHIRACARRGDAGLVEQLLWERFRDPLSTSAARLLGSHAQDKALVERLIRQTCREAARQLEHFEGTTTADLDAWLQLVLSRHLQQPPATAAPLAADEATLRALRDRQPAADEPAQPPSPETWGRGQETLVKPSLDNDDAAGEAPIRQAETFMPQPHNVHEMRTLAPGEEGPTGPLTSLSSRSFGDYELLETIARGGMGVVHKARQRKLNRIVAIKMILSGQFADQLDVDRFYAEAEAAANLRHPNIVAIHEVGQCEGQHYFSMDYIEGQSLAELVREHPLPPRIAAQYVKTVAQAMQYAHEQGILHRDLKPSNILLDRTNEPLITDFGLAKQVEGQSQLTMSGTIVGTPSYMPPEQAAGQGDRVSPRSDVYSSGAILYELITGGPPFRAANPFETIKQVLEKEPVSPRLVNPSVPVDLETICLKCLQKEPNARYQTARELAEELDRYLAGKPIQARPVSVRERFWRWCRRNPRIATLSGFLLLAVLMAMGIFAWGYITSSAALAQAQQRLNQTRKAVDELFTLVSENRLLNEPGAQSLRKELLLKARDLYREILEQQRDDPQSRGDLARSYFRLGVILEKIDSPEDALVSYGQALSMQQSLLKEQTDDATLLYELSNTWNNIGTASQKLERLDDASRAFQEAGRIRQQLVTLQPTHIEYQRKLANTVMNLGVFEKERRRFPQAKRLLERAQRIRRDFLQHTDDPQMRRDYLQNYYNLANLALTVRDQAVRSGSPEENRQAQRDLALAVNAYEQAVADFEGRIQSGSVDLENQHNLAKCMFLHADLKVAMGDYEEASRRYQKGQQLLQKLVRENPDVLEYRASLAKLLINFGGLQLLAESDKPPQERPGGAARALQSLRLMLQSTDQMLAALTPDGEARTSYQQARELLEALLKRNPDVADYRDHYAAVLRGIANLDWMEGRLEPARRNLETSRDYLQRLAEEYPDHQKYQVELDQTLGNLAGVQIAMSRLLDDEAMAWTRIHSARQMLDRLIRKYPSDRFYRFHLAIALYEIGLIEWGRDELSEACASLKQSYGILHQLARDHPEQQYWLHLERAQGSLAGLYVQLGNAVRRQENSKMAYDYFQQAATMLEPLVERYPTVGYFQTDFEDALRQLSAMQVAHGNHGEARVNLEKLLAQLEHRGQQTPGDEALTALIDQTRQALEELPKPSSPPASDKSQKSEEKREKRSAKGDFECGVGNTECGVGNAECGV